METTVQKEQTENSSTFSYTRRVNTNDFWPEKKHTYPELILYYSLECPHCIRVMDYLSKLNKSVEIKDISDSKEVKEELRVIGGKSQVPCLTIDGKALYESLDIIRWISENKEGIPSLES